MCTPYIFKLAFQIKHPARGLIPCTPSRPLPFLEFMALNKNAANDCFAADCGILFSGLDKSGQISMPFHGNLTKP